MVPASMSAELIAVGSELLRPGRHESNTVWLAERLERLGIPVSGRRIVGDDPARIASAVAAAVRDARVVIVTGGLGPTEDDRTREGLAGGLGKALVRDEDRLAALRDLFQRFGRPFHESQASQAELPAGAEFLENPLGTAPGIVLESDDRLVFAVPGVPAEMRRMFDEQIAPRLAGFGTPLRRRTLKVAGRTESQVDLAVADLFDLPGTESSILIGSEGIELHLGSRGSSAEQAGKRLADLERRMSERLGPDLYGRDEETLAAVVGGLLSAANRTVAVAESCTAGALAARITSEPGSSAWFRGGLIVYHDDLKLSLAGVSSELLELHGAVSPEVAEALARGARTRCAASFGIGVTGIAGPGGGTAEKPVGLVHLALDDGVAIHRRRLRQFGDRLLVRRRTVVAALDLLRRRLLGVETG